MLTKLKLWFRSEELSELDAILSVFNAVVSKLNTFRAKTAAARDANEAAIAELNSVNAELMMHEDRAQRILTKLEEITK